MDPVTVAATPLPLGPITLLPGIELSPRLTLYPPTLHLVLSFEGVPFYDQRLDLARRELGFRHAAGPLHVDLRLTVDLSRGELVAHGEIRAGELRRAFDAERVVRWAPMLGSVGGSIEAHPPPVNDPAGPVRAVLPVINRIPISSVPRLGTDVGARVKEVFFPDHPEFLFNVCFAVGPAPADGPGAYGDPDSPWFNVFCGYYQIDCLKRDWDRPFGYRAGAAGEPFEVVIDDVVRVGKADWNYLSNWMYGVPIEAVAAHDDLDVCASRPRPPRIAVGGRAWDVVDVERFTVVTTFESGAPGSGRLRENSLLTPLWRAAFGPPSGRVDAGASFPPAAMRARFYMAWSEDEEAFHTYLFGGTVNQAFDGPANDALLHAQMTAVEQVIAQHYAALGFPPEDTY